MANLEIKDGSGAQKYVKASGAGTNLDPHIPEHTVSGTVNVIGPLTDADLRVSPVSVNWAAGTVSIAGTPTVSPAEPTLAFVAGTLAASGDGTVIAAPGAGSTLVVSAWQVQNEGTASQTYLVKFGTVTVWRALAYNQGDGVACVLPPGREWHVGDNLPLVVNQSAEAVSNYNVVYTTEAV